MESILEPSTVVAGVDGCPGGWAVAFLTVQSAGVRPRLELERVEGLGDVVAMVRTGALGALAIDMPIGLLDVHPRPADVEARAMLGPRKSSVFPTPLRTTLTAEDYHSACERSRAACGKALSKQAWHLIPKIRELDQLLEPADQDHIVEAHPECGFARLNGEPLAHAKATDAGRSLRLDLLHHHLGVDAVTAIEASTVAPKVDLIDAAVNAATAARVLDGSAIRLGGQIDETGLRAEIVY